ncbi:MAG: AAA family ATPase [Polyangiaceae bacterium]|nr:AAA family ATPase [Polyangiaceae bacterium]
MTDEAAAQSPVFGRYRLLAPLGGGALTEAFRAKSFGVEGFEKTVVVKRLRAALARLPAVERAFTEQARRSVRLSHANVVQVFDLGRAAVEGAEVPFVVEEWVSGWTARQLIDRIRQADGLPAEPMLLHVLAEICKALDHAHRRRDETNRSLDAAHGGLAPSNVLLTWEGEVKVSDFCVSTALAAAPADVARPALRWAAPELALGARPAASSDLFSLGALALEWASSERVVVGRAAIAGSSPWVEDALARASAHLSSHLVELLRRLVSPAPGDRPASAAAVHDELMRLVYSSGARFGPRELAELLETHQDRALLPPPRVELASVDVERTPTQSRRKPAPIVAVRELVAADALAGELAVLAVAGLPEAARGEVERLIARSAGARVAEAAWSFGRDGAGGREVERAVGVALAMQRLGAGAAVRVGARSAAGAPADEAARLVPEARAAAARAAGRVLLAVDATTRLHGRYQLEETEEPAWLAVGELRAHEVAYGRFVGRRAELRRLGEAIAEASAKHPRVVGVVGDPGTGKTRLLLEMERRVARGAFAIAVHAASCAPRGRDAPLSGVLAAVRVLAGLPESPAPDVETVARPRLRSLGLLEDEAEALLAELGLLHTGDGGGGDAVERAFVRLLHGATAERVLVLAWDSAHELDEASVEVLERALAKLGAARLVLVFLGIPGEPAPFVRLSGYDEISLGGLEPDETERLSALRLGCQRVPAELLAVVLDRSGGRPMYVEELLREALERGAVVLRDGEVAEVRAPELGAIPLTLRALLAARLERLTPAERNVVVAAAILGPIADTSVLATMLDVSPGVLAELAAQLDARALLLRSGPLALRFGSPLLREVVLDSLSDEVRRRLNGEAADAWRRVLGDRTEEQANRVGYHLAEAGEPDRAAGFYATSGLHALETRALERAAHDLARALELADLATRDAPEVLEWVSWLSRALRHARACGAPVTEAFTRLESWLPEAPCDARAKARAAVDLARVATTLLRPDDTRRWLAFARAAAQGSAELSRACLGVEAELAIAAGSPARALEAVDRATALGTSEPLEAHRLGVLAAQALAALGRSADAAERLAAAEQCVSADDAVLACERAKTRSVVLAIQGDDRAALDECSRAAALARGADLRHELAVCLHNQAELHFRLGDGAAAFAVAQSSLESALAAGADRVVLLDRMFLALLEATNGGGAAPLAELERAIAAAERRGWAWEALTGRCWRGLALGRLGDARARRALGEARAAAARSSLRYLVDDCDRELAALGRPSAPR